MPQNVSRREFLGASAIGLAAGASAVTDTAGAAAKAVGIKCGDLPDLTIKEVKVYVLKAGAPAISSPPPKLAAIVTNSGIEGNYALGYRYWHPNWSNLGWLDYAKRVLPGKSVLNLPELTSQWAPDLRRQGQLSYASAIDSCLWDILGKAVGLPVYRILGAYKERVLAYGSSQHHKTLEEFVTEVQRCKAQGFKAYKIHPPGGDDGKPDNYKLDMEICKAVRGAAGDDFTLMLDPVGVYTRYEAMKVGRLLDELGYVVFEDPIPTTDIDGLVELCAALDVPIHIGEFLFSPYAYGEYIRRGALDALRFVVDNVGGITGGVKIGRLAECFGMPCVPHNWGTVFDQAVHFHCELAMPNAEWFEKTLTYQDAGDLQGASDLPYVKTSFRVAKDGYVYAPIQPGLGCEVDRDALDKMTLRVET
jgi:L-alanine-DL-glutamate epimerase-like enolase superfamily enzyme